MRKLVVLVLFALLFVGCEKKEGGKEDSKATKVVESKIGTFDLTVNLPKGGKIQEGLVGGFDIMVGAGGRFNISEGSEYTTQDFKSALEDAKSNTWNNVKGEEVTSGYYITYDMDSFGKTFEIVAQIEKDKKPFRIYGVAKNEKDQAAMVALCKSIK